MVWLAAQSQAGYTLCVNVGSLKIGASDIQVIIGLACRPTFKGAASIQWAGVIK